MDSNALQWIPLDRICVVQHSHRQEFPPFTSQIRGEFVMDRRLWPGQQTLHYLDTLWL
jgi:hypothetical protein